MSINKNDNIPLNRSQTNWIQEKQDNKKVKLLPLCPEELLYADAYKTITYEGEQITISEFGYFLVFLENYFNTMFFDKVVQKHESYLNLVKNYDTLRDPSKISLEHAQSYSDFIGADFNIREFYELSSFDTSDETFDFLKGPEKLIYSQKESALFDYRVVENKVQNILEMLPFWYKLKGTTASVRAALFFIGMIGDARYYSTTNYDSPNTSSDWKLNPYTENEIDTVGNMYDNQFYDQAGLSPTYHFIIEIYNKETNYLNANFDKLVAFINKIKPVGHVFLGFNSFISQLQDDLINNSNQLQYFIGATENQFEETLEIESIYTGHSSITVNGDKFDLTVPPINGIIV